MPEPCKVLPLVFAILKCLQKAISQFCQPMCFRMMGNMVRPVNSMNMGPLPHFICCEMSFMTRSNSYYNAYAMIVDKAFCSESLQMVVLAEALHVGKANSY